MARPSDQCDDVALRTGTWAPCTRHDDPGQRPTGVGNGNRHRDPTRSGGRVHAPGTGAHVQRVACTSTPTTPIAELGAFVRIGQPPQRGPRRGDDVRVPARRTGRFHVHAARRSPTTSASTPAARSFEVVEPFEELRVAIDGKVVMLTEPLEMADPEQAFTDNPYDRCTIDLTFAGRRRPGGRTRRSRSERPGEEFAKGHYEQLTTGHRHDRRSARTPSTIDGPWPPRPLLGTAHLAGPVVLPLAHGEHG